MWKAGTRERGIGTAELDISRNRFPAGAFDNALFGLFSKSARINEPVWLIEGFGESTSLTWARFFEALRYQSVDRSLIDSVERLNVRSALWRAAQRVR